MMATSHTNRNSSISKSSIQLKHKKNAPSSATIVNISHGLYCQKHPEKLIEKICTKPGCQSQMIFCTQCYFESQNHIANHRQYIMNFNQFIEYCKCNSTRYKDQFGTRENARQFNEIISNLDSQIIKYQMHLKKEQDKIDNDFDELIRQFTSEIEELKTKLKDSMRNELNDFLELGKSLRKKAEEINNQRSSNQDYNNDYDDFLSNFESAIASKRGYNFKRLISNITPLINKAHNQFQKTNILGVNNSSNINNVPANHVVINLKTDTCTGMSGPGAKLSMGKDEICSTVGSNENMSCVSGFSLASNFTINFAGNAIYAPLKDIFGEIKEMVNNKPFYRNHGEANKIFRESFVDARQVYLNLLKVSNQFLVIHQSQKLGLQNLEKNLTPNQRSSNIVFNSSGSPQGLITEVQQQGSSHIQQTSITSISHFTTNNVMTSSVNYQRTLTGSAEQMDCNDYNLGEINTVSLDQDQHVTTIDYLKTLTTSHKGGIFAMVMIDTETLVTGSNDKTVKVWRLTDFSLVKEVKFKTDVTSLAILPRHDHSKMVLVGLYKSFALLNQNYDIILEREGQHQASINCCLGLKDGETVITCSNDPKIVVWNLFNSEVMVKKYFDHRDAIYAMELFENRDLLATGGRDRTIQIWQLNYFRDYRNNCLDRLVLDMNLPDAHNTDVTALQSSQMYPDILFSASADGEVKIWDIITGNLIRNYKNYSGWVYKILLIERPLPMESRLVGGKRRNFFNFDCVSSSCNTLGSLDNAENVHPFVKKGINPPVSTTNKSTKNIKLQERALSPQCFQGVTPIQNLLSSPKNNGSQAQIKVDLDFLNQIQFVTTSFDGSLKIWEAVKDTPIFNTQIKNYLDCYPFGGISIYRPQGEDNIYLLTSGNKNDADIHLWSLK